MGAQWLAHLPSQIAELERNWGFRAGAALDHSGAVSWVAPVELKDGSQAILKIGLPYPEAQFEGEFLRRSEGYGAVRVLEISADGFSLLLERCCPGTDLWSLNEEEGNAIACKMLPRIWRAPDPGAPFTPLSDYVASWWENLPRLAAIAACDERIVTEAVALADKLLATQPQTVLLHGDFHPGNVLAAEREPWLFIDPKPLTGDPAYDLAQWLYNRARFLIDSGDSAALLRKLIERFGTELGLDPARIAGWTFIKALGWEYGPEFFTLFHEVKCVYY